MSCNTQAEEVEEGYTDGDDNARPKHRGGVNHLVPAAGQVEEGGLIAEAREQGHEDKDGNGAEEALEANSYEGCNRVPTHDLLFDDELGCGAGEKIMRWRLAEQAEYEQDLGEENKEDSDKDFSGFRLVDRLGWRQICGTEFKRS